MIWRFYSQVSYKLKDRKDRERSTSRSSCTKRRQLFKRWLKAAPEDKAGLKEL